MRAVESDGKKERRGVLGFEFLLGPGCHLAVGHFVVRDGNRTPVEGIVAVRGRSTRLSMPLSGSVALSVPREISLPG